MTKYYHGDYNKAAVIGGMCRTHGTAEKFYTAFLKWNAVS
jgi:hypothetical protein